MHEEFEGAERVFCWNACRHLKRMRSIFQVCNQELCKIEGLFSISGIHQNWRNNFLIEFWVMRKSWTPAYFLTATHILSFYRIKRQASLNRFKWCLPCFEILQAPLLGIYFLEKFSKKYLQDCKRPLREFSWFKGSMDLELESRRSVTLKGQVLGTILK